MSEKGLFCSARPIGRFGDCFQACSTGMDLTHGEQQGRMPSHRASWVHTRALFQMRGMQQRLVCHTFLCHATLPAAMLSIFGFDMTGHGSGDDGRTGGFQIYQESHQDFSEGLNESTL